MCCSPVSFKEFPKKKKTPKGRERGKLKTAEQNKANGEQTGTPKTYDIKGDSGKINKHFFCSNCGSSLYTELEVMPTAVCIKAGSLDDGAAALDGKVAVEFYTKDRVSYLHDQAGAKQVEAFGA